jgi:hypothetical protein
MRKFSLAAVLAVLLLVPVGIVPVAQADTPIGEATFNTPRPYAGPKENFAIVNRVQRAINATPGYRKGKPREVIHITTYLMDRTSTVTALIDACRRGVAVRVIIDELVVNRNARRLISALNGDNVRDRNHDGKADSKPKARACNRPLRKHRTTASGRTVPTKQNQLMSARRIITSVDAPVKDSVTWGKDGSYVKRCRPSCRSNQGNMHMKIYLFSHTGRYRDTVMVSSSNINRGGAFLGWNDMYTMYNRPKSYEQYVNWHRRMTMGTPAPKQRVEIKDGPFTTRFFPIRKAGRHRDPALSDLNQIKCHGPLGPTQMYISMFYWKGHRGSYLADKVLSLARSGCQVHIIYGAPSRLIAERLRNAARAHLIDLYDSRWDYNEDGEADVRTHSKFVAVRGSYEGKGKKWVVMTGSPNWVVGSLNKGDEVTLNIELKSAYAAYVRAWQRVRAHSRKLPYYG